MIDQPHLPAPSRRRLDRLRPGEPDLRSVILGTLVFLLVAAACLYLVARLGA